MYPNVCVPEGGSTPPPSPEKGKSEKKKKYIKNIKIQKKYINPKTKTERKIKKKQKKKKTHKITEKTEHNSGPLRADSPKKHSGVNICIWTRFRRSAIRMDYLPWLIILLLLLIFTV